MSVAEISLWPGSSSFSPGKTNFGIYDNDVQFQLDIDKFAKWAGNRLGFPITDLEIQDIHFYAAYEEAVSEYGAQVNLFNARDNLINVQGMSTASVEMSQNYVQPSLSGVLQIAKEYGTAAGSGGTLKWYSGSIDVVKNKQVYDFLDTGSVSLEAGSLNEDVFTIKKIMHQGTPEVSRYLDPTLGTFGTYRQLLGEFGWNQMSRPVDFMMMPLHHDLMRLQSIEFHTQIRRSAYSFKLTGTRLRIFPVPSSNYKLDFYYTLDEEALDSNASGSSDDKISDISNIPYSDITYSKLNSPARQWIRQYGLAIVKETLGWVRNKYADSLPIPDNELSVNGSALIDDANEEKQELIESLKETLESTSRQAQLERKQAEREALQSQLAGVPKPIYVR